jgi:predicted phosphodiesterase
MRLAVIADVHGNLPALEAVLADIRNRRADRIINLGDCVSGPLWPRETCARLIDSGLPTVRGNHDRWVATAADMGQWDRYALGQLDEGQLAWLRDLPPLLKVDGLLACHGRPGDDIHYLMEDIEHGRLVRAPAEKITRRLGRADAALVLCGHSHHQHMVCLPDGLLLLNPGSVGQPAYRDPAGKAHVSEAGSPHARYALVEMGERGTTVDLIAVEYDHASAAKRAAANDAPAWAHALATGFALPAT